MKAHGEYSIRVDGHFVYINASSAFNEEGVQAFFIELFQKTEQLDYWVLFNNLAADTGLTPEGMEQSQKMNYLLAQNGCIGIANLIDSPMVQYLTQKIASDSTIPWKMSNNEGELKNFLNEILKNHKQK